MIRPRLSTLALLAAALAPMHEFGPPHPGATVIDPVPYKPERELTAQDVERIEAAKARRTRRAARAGR